MAAGSQGPGMPGPVLPADRCPWEVFPHRLRAEPPRGAKGPGGYPNGNSAFCLSMANIFSRVMVRVAVMFVFSTLLSCPVSSL